MYAHCRFFLESSGPQHAVGNKQTLSFLINMASLFELYVVEWLKKHLSKTIKLDFQHTLQLRGTAKLTFKIDLVMWQ